MLFPSTIVRFFRWGCLSVLSGLLAGLSAGLFLILLDHVTKVRIENPRIIWALPVAGLLIGLLYHHFGQTFARGNQRVLAEVHGGRRPLPVLMAPFILLSTLVTHLFGGSSGREGTAVQMGAALSDQLPRLFKLESWERQALLAAGAGAGFGAAIGAPWAGAVFGVEILRQWKRSTLIVALWCLGASMVGHSVTLWMGAPHTEWPLVAVPHFEIPVLLYLLIAGLIFGISARWFNGAVRWVEKSFHLFSYPPFRPFWGGLLLLGFFWWEGSLRYAGLGIESIQQALLTQDQIPSMEVPFLKAIATALTIGSGFKGGEFIPLVFIGATLGAALALFLPVSSSLLAALGFSAVFGAAAKVPFACAIMAMEIFGWQLGPYALMVGLTADYFSGPSGIYRAN